MAIKLGCCHRTEGVKSRHSRRGAPVRHTLHIIRTRPSRRVFYWLDFGASGLPGGASGPGTGRLLRPR
nr:MAG TPA: hypothetical protein [Caudoviricetes sp.]